MRNEEAGGDKSDVAVAGGDPVAITSKSLDARPARRRTLAFAVHLFTASGAVCGLLALLVLAVAIRFGLSLVLTPGDVYSMAVQGGAG